METYVSIRTLCKAISKDFVPVIGLILWYLSINFGYEINLKFLMYLVLVDLKRYADFLIGKIEEALYFPSALVFVANW